MSLFKNIGGFISRFKDAVQAGADFNPLLMDVMKDIETLYAQGKLDDVVFHAEQSYEREHAAYTAKGTHTTAYDSKTDSHELAHFLKVLASDDNMPQSLKENADRLINMKDEMMKALGPLGKLAE